MPADPATYDQIANIQAYYPVVQLPYRRPCTSLCTAITYLGSCGGSLEATLGSLMPSCALTYPLTDGPAGGYFSIYSADPTQCNALASTAGMPLVADKTEPYVGKACQGVTTSLYIPASSMVDPTGRLAPLLPPFVLQSVLEAQLSAIFAATPRWLKQDCNTAQRTLLCPTKLLKAQPLDNLLAVFGTTVYLPSFPARSLCENYRAQCPFLVNNVPELNINCSQVLMGVQAFPERDQVVLSIPELAFFGPLVTAPNALPELDAAFGVPSQCPWGFAVPTLPLMRGTYFILPDTACAADCPLKIYSHAEMAIMNKLVLQNSVIILAALLITTIQLGVMPLKRQSLFINILVGFGLLSSFLFFIHMMVGHGPDSSSPQCSSATSWYAAGDEHDSPNTDAASVCMLFASVDGISGYVMSWAIVSIWGDAWCKVVCSMRDLSRVRIIYCYIPGVVFLALILQQLIYTETEGTWNSQFEIFPRCTAKTGNDTIDNKLPMGVSFVISILAISFYSAFMYKVIGATRKVTPRTALPCLTLPLSDPPYHLPPTSPPACLPGSLEQREEPNDEDLEDVPHHFHVLGADCRFKPGGHSVRIHLHQPTSRYSHR